MAIQQRIDTQAAIAEADRQVGVAADLYRQGNAAGAESLCREALAHVPAHRDAQVLLGVILHFEARYGEAEELFATLAMQEPREATHWINLGTARRGGKRYDDALLAYTRAAEIGAPSADLLLNIGLTHLDRCDFEAARAVLSRAAELAPTDAEIRYRYAQSSYECLRTEEASRTLLGWEALPDLTSELAANIGSLLMNLGEAERAAVALHQAELDPAPDPAVSLTLVQVLERTNRITEARERFATLATDPRARLLAQELLVTDALLAERESQHTTAVQLLEQALRDMHGLERRHFQLFRLAKSLDALKRYEDAYQTLLEAHRSQAAYIAMTAPAVSLRGVPTMQVTRFGCDPADVATWDDSAAPSVEASPIFIVAFPRSGTTLLEQALDAHPLLQSMDEQPFVQNALDELGAASGGRYPTHLGELSNAQLEAVRGAYWRRVGTKVNLAAGERLIDKNPLNILRLPVIRRLFPHARILLPVRHPCDVLLSCFMQHFRAPDFALLCGDLGTLAQGYRRTMDFWYQELALLGSVVREIHYESFVANFEAQMRSISEFLALPWDERMLAPATHARAKGYISTPSYGQVVQPVNQKSVGRWRAYEAHFAPLLPLLRPYLDRWGYEA